MKNIYAIIFLILSGPSALACSFAPPQVSLKIKQQWEKLFPHNIEEEISIPRPVAKIVNIKRAVIGPGMTCGDAGLISIDISLPPDSREHIKDYLVYFHVIKGEMPVAVFPDFPLNGYIQGNRKTFTFAWLDGHPSRQIDIDATVEISLVSKDIKIGPKAPVQIKIKKSSLALDNHWSWLSLPILTAIANNKSKETYIRVAAVEKLGDFGFYYFLKQVSGNLFDATEPESLRDKIAQIWAGTQSDEGLKILVKVAKLNNPELRLSAIKVLGYYKGKLTTRLIAEGLKDKSSKIRFAAVNSLPYSRLKEFLHLIIPLLNDKSRKVQLRAALSLGSLKHPKAYPLLIKFFRLYEGFEKLPILFAISGYENKDSIPLFVEALNSEHEFIREASLTILKQFNMPEADKAVKEYTNKQSIETGNQR